MAINIHIDTTGNQEPPLQINLGKKLDQLKQLCRDTPALHPFHENTRNMSALIKTWGQDRDFLIHSTLIGFEDNPPRMVVRHVEHPKGLQMVIGRGDFTLEVINGFAAQVRGLHRELYALIEIVSPLQPNNETQKAGQQNPQAAPKTKPIPL